VLRVCRRNAAQFAADNLARVDLRADRILALWRPHRKSNGNCKQKRPKLNPMGLQWAKLTAHDELLWAIGRRSAWWTINYHLESESGN